MKENLTKLLDLQEIDSAIDDLKKSREEYPKEIERLGQELKAAKEALCQKEEDSQELEKNRRHFERELEVANGELKEHQGRLYQRNIKTNREYDALQGEIQTYQKKIDLSESEILAAMEGIEELKTKMEVESGALAEMDAEKSSKISELSEKLRSLDGDIDALEGKGKIVQDGVDRRALSVYKRVRRGKSIAVVPVMKGACGGCFRQLPPQRASEIRRNDRVIACESCGRILVWKADKMN